jgi:predicted PurR-regulated permease PerM
MDFTRQHIEEPKLRQLTDNLLASLQASLSQLAPALGSAGGGALKAAAFLAHAAIVPVYLFFLLLLRRNLGESLRAQLVHLRPSWRDTLLFLVNEFVSIIVAFFRGQLLICLVVGVLYGIAFTCVGLKFGLFIGLAIGLLNIVPFLGSTLGLCAILPLAFFQPGGGLSVMLLALAAFALVQALDGWFVTPRVMGNSTGLHPLAIIISVFFWATVFNNILGVVLAIPLTAFLVTTWRLLKQRATPPPAPGNPPPK